MTKLSVLIFLIVLAHHIAFAQEKPDSSPVQKRDSLSCTVFSHAPFYSLEEIYSGSRLMGVFGGNSPTGYWDNHTAVGLVFGADLVLPLTCQLNWHVMADYQWNLEKFKNKTVDIALFDYGPDSYGYKSWRSIWVLTGPSFIFAGENDNIRFEPGVGIGFSYISYPGQDLFDENISESANLAYEVSLPFIFGKTKTVEIFGRWSKKTIDEIRLDANYDRTIVPVIMNFNEVGIRLKFQLERSKSPKKAPF